MWSTDLWFCRARLTESKNMRYRRISYACDFVTVGCHIGRIYSDSFKSKSNPTHIPWFHFAWSPERLNPLVSNWEMIKKTETRHIPSAKLGVWKYSLKNRMPLQIPVGHVPSFCLQIVWHRHRGSIVQTEFFSIKNLDSTIRSIAVVKMIPMRNRISTITIVHSISLSVLIRSSQSSMFPDRWDYRLEFCSMMH